jgi:hypothetical protein
MFIPDSVSMKRERRKINELTGQIGKEHGCRFVRCLALLMGWLIVSGLMLAAGRVDILLTKDQKL